MKNRSLVTPGRALNVLAAAALVLLSTGASALGLGRVNVQSVLGETLHAEIEVTSLSPEEASSLRVSLASPDAFKASGVDYNAVLAGATITLSRRADGRPVLVLASDRVVQEPFVDVIVDFQWATGHLSRSYTLLIDPPGRNTAAQPATTATAPVFSAPPPAPRPVAPPPPVAVALPPAPDPAPAPVARAPSPAPAAPAPTASSRAPTPTASHAPAPAAAARSPRKAASASASAPAPMPAPAEKAPGQATIKVRPGDTLGALAAGNKPADVSLDQMLVSLYRGNPSAFIGDNMNRLRSGVTLTVPGADAAKQISSEEAHQVIQAQSADFSAYRHRLAGGVATVQTDNGSHGTSGKVEARINDRKTAAAPPAPDKLMLSRGTAKPGTALSEANDSKETQRKAEAARVAELSRNVAELKKLSESQPGPAPASPTVRTPAPAPVPALPAVTLANPATPLAPKPAPVPPPAPVTPAPAPAPALQPPVAASAAATLASTAAALAPPLPTSAPAVQASAPEAVASALEPVAAPSAPVVASAPFTPASVPSLPAAEPADEDDGFLSSLLDPPYIFPGLAALVVALGGFLLWRRRKASRKLSSETSFIESKIQPDSFFGASGGQRVDTRDGSNNSASSSLNYSLSQLDAIGDVDPVAEADVYLAYGRDLQAEEILKEAQRSDPDRLAIRTKLLEVYAKRADLKTFEAQAHQLQGLTGGHGEDWSKAQELGRQIDPTNPLYTEGGEYAIVDTDPIPLNPANPAKDDSEMTLMRPPEHGEAHPDGAHADLPIDFDHSIPASQVAPTQPMNMESSETARQPHPGVPAAPPFEVSDFDLEPGHVEPPAAPHAAPAPAPMPLSAPPLAPVSAPAPALAAAPAPAAHAANPGPPSINFDFGDLSLDLDKPPHPAAEDAAQVHELQMPAHAPESEPMARKIELADEFRRIGDHEGARELLEEVVAKAEGPLKTRAQTMLEALG